MAEWLSPKQQIGVRILWRPPRGSLASASAYSNGGIGAAPYGLQTSRMLRVSAENGKGKFEYFGPLFEFEE